VLDNSTIYRAILSEIDPTPIGPIDFVKNKLSLNNNINKFIFQG